MTSQYLHVLSSFTFQAFWPAYLAIPVPPVRLCKKRRTCNGNTRRLDCAIRRTTAHGASCVASGHQYIGCLIFSTNRYLQLKFITASQPQMCVWVIWRSTSPQRPCDCHLKQLAVRVNLSDDIFAQLLKGVKRWERCWAGRCRVIGTHSRQYVMKRATRRPRGRGLQVRSFASCLVIAPSYLCNLSSLTASAL